MKHTRFTATCMAAVMALSLLTSCQGKGAQSGTTAKTSETSVTSAQAATSSAGEAASSSEKDAKESDTSAAETSSASLEKKDGGETSPAREEKEEASSKQDEKRVDGEAKESAKGEQAAAATKDDKEGKAARQEPVKGEITFWHSFSQGPRLENIQKTADAFVKENPETKIKIETFSWADFYKKWTTGLASGNVPDISSALPNHVVEMIDADAILPLDDMIDAMGRDRFYEAPLKEMTKDGKCYAVPLYSHAQVMWYRKDLLEKYKLNVPTTWEELYEAASTIQKGEKGAVYGCSVPLGTGDMMATRYLNFYVRSAGERLLKEDNTANLTSPAALEGIKYWVKMYKDNSPEDSINFGVLDQATLYYQGKNAFDFNSGFHIGGVQTNSPDLMDKISCAPLPTVKGQEQKAGCETSNIPMVVWKKSKNPETCKAFIRFMYQPEHYVPFLHSVPVGMLPALKDIAEDKAFLDNPTVKKFEAEKKVIAKAMDVGTAIGMEKGPVPQAGLLTSQHVIEAMFQEILLKNTPVEEAAAAAEKKLNELFETAGN